MDNSRKDLRVLCSIPVMVHFPSGKPEESIAVIYDLSAGGMKIETSHNLKRGEDIFLSFVVLNKYHFRNIKGTILRVIQRSDKYEVGIKFDSQKDKNNLIEAVGILAHK